MVRLRSKIQINTTTNIVCLLLSRFLGQQLVQVTVVAHVVEHAIHGEIGTVKVHLNLVKGIKGHGTATIISFVGSVGRRLLVASQLVGRLHGGMIHHYDYDALSVFSVFWSGRMLRLIAVVDVCSVNQVKASCCSLCSLFHKKSAVVTFTVKKLSIEIELTWGACAGVKSSWKMSIGTLS